MTKPRLLVSLLALALCPSVCLSLCDPDCLGRPEKEVQALSPFELDQIALQENNATASDRGYGGVGCVEACELLKKLVPEYKFDAETTLAFKEQTVYWSGHQAAVTPRCFVQPSTAEHVGDIIRTVRQTQCHFAVKSGGHAPQAGASNAADGVTIDLSLLNELTLSDDRESVRVGAGNRWGDVYEYLDPKHLTVVGGRLTEVGVGGLTLGGGLSFLTGRHGWAMDNVRNYEVVVATGEVLDVNPNSHPDLFWALRGGGNNFGVVTRFDLATFPLDRMWGGSLATGIEHNETVISHFADVGSNASADVDAQIFSGIIYANAYKTWFTNTQLTHIAPAFARESSGGLEADYTVEDEYPALFANFSTVPKAQSSLRRSNMSDLTREINRSTPSGLFETFWTWTSKLDKELTQFDANVFREEVAPIEHVDNLMAAMVWQHVSPATIESFGRNGGNAIGLDSADGPLIIGNINIMWTDPTAHDAVMTAARNTVRRMTDEARSRGLHHPFLYQNYASEEQKVFESYGDDNLKRLRDISMKYDPDQVFQKLQPGYFKLYQ